MYYKTTRERNVSQTVSNILPSSLPVACLGFLTEWITKFGITELEYSKHIINLKTHMVYDSKTKGEKMT